MEATNRKLKRIYVPYWMWEDWKNGMWRKLPKRSEKWYLDRAIQFTGDHEQYGKAMKEVVTFWKYTMLNSLTNTSINRRAFLGHCAAQYRINCPEYITRMAWKQLSEKQRFLADKVAQETINEWILNHEEKNSRIYRNMGTQMLLKWNS